MNPCVVLEKFDKKTRVENADGRLLLPNSVHTYVFHHSMENNIGIPEKILHAAWPSKKRTKVVTK